MAGCSGLAGPGFGCSGLTATSFAEHLFWIQEVPTSHCELFWHSILDALNLDGLNVLFRVPFLGLLTA